MQFNPQDKTMLQQFTMVAKKIIYEPSRMKTFMKMLNSKEGAVQAVHTVIAAIEKLKPIPPQIRGLLGVNTYLLMVDIAQEVTKMKPDTGIVKEVIGMIMTETQAPAAPAPAAPQDPGMLAQMQEKGEPPGDPATPDNTAAHETAEPAAMEQQEGAEEDPQAGMLANMQRRRMA